MLTSLKQEGELALPMLSNGKAVGGAGWPAKLLQYSAQYVIMDDGDRHKVRILGLPLTRLLTAFVLVHCCPSFPQRSSLLSKRRGCTLDAVHYQHMAGGEPPYSLYTIILNRWRVPGCEEHQLCSLTQAGFRPRQSPAHHLFALRRFIDTPCISKRPHYAGLWTPRRLMTLFSIILSGASWSPLGWGPEDWQAPDLWVPVGCST